MLDILSKKNLVIEKFFIDEKNSFKQESETLRELLLIWLDELYTNSVK